MVGQNLFAHLGEFGAILLEARQNRHVAVIHHGAAMPGHITGATVYLSRIGLRRRDRCDQNQRKDEKSSDHVGRFHMRSGTSSRAGAANRTRTCDPVITNDVLYQLSYCGGPCDAFGKV